MTANSLSLTGSNLMRIFPVHNPDCIGRQIGEAAVPCGRKRKRKKISTHKRKKKLRKNRHKKKGK